MEIYLGPKGMHEDSEEFEEWESNLSDKLNGGKSPKNLGYEKKDEVIFVDAKEINDVLVIDKYKNEYFTWTDGDDFLIDTQGYSKDMEWELEEWISEKYGDIDGMGNRYEDGAISDTLDGKGIKYVDSLVTFDIGGHDNIWDDEDGTLLSIHGFYEDRTEYKSKEGFEWSEGSYAKHSSIGLKEKYEGISKEDFIKKLKIPDGDYRFSSDDKLHDKYLDWSEIEASGGANYQELDAVPPVKNWPIKLLQKAVDDGIITDLQLQAIKDKRKAKK